MDKLLVITGPTASGKTGLALSLAKNLNAELISADSRQLYKYLDLGTGKDLPENAKFIAQDEFFPNKNANHNYGYYLFDNVPVWGLDIVDPKYRFNISEYEEYAKNVINHVLKKGKLPIIVGGTGLYIRSLLEDLEMTSVPNNDLLRKELETLSIDELISRLEKVDKEKLASLNDSDRKNPRRLIRAIEISQSETSPKIKQSLEPLNTMLIVLSGSIDFLAQKINARSRGDLEKEVKKILSLGYGFDLQSMSALVYREFENPRTIEEIISRWNVLDRQYAKKQLTFFKKYFPPKTNTIWVSVEKKDWDRDVFELVSKWYTAGSEN